MAARKNAMRPRMTYDRHRKIGGRLHALNLELVHELMPEIIQAYGKASRAAIALQGLRSEMDTLACRENPRDIYPDREPHRLYLGRCAWIVRRGA